MKAKLRVIDERAQVAVSVWRAVGRRLSRPSRLYIRLDQGKLRFTSALVAPHFPTRAPFLYHHATHANLIKMGGEYDELKRNAMILGAWIAAIRVAPYVAHLVQGAFSR